jgi:hypothetical protein
LFASCADAAVLIALVAELQRLAAHRRLGAVVAAIAIACASSLVGSFAAAFGSRGDASVTRYLLVALAVDVAAFGFARARQPRSRGGPGAIGSRP